MIGLFKSEFLITRRYEAYLACFYACACGILVRYSSTTEQVQRATIFLCTLWLGFLLAVSLMEAWVKFKAPLLLKHIAVDVGRHVFAALNIVECCFMLTICVLRYFGGGAPLAPLVTVSGCLCVQLAILSPILNTLAKFKILQIIEESKDIAEKAYAVQLKGEVLGLSPAKPVWHVAYVAMEVIKVVLLCYMIYAM